ncbi:silent information regulator protein Sir2, partial [Alistipes sp. OttesenSCG-928-L06]|nr:silent information regulator protein Sir2 [Alistipes sp. OttesenSCG-928-L06]
TFLWRKDLGWNIEQGVWYSPMVVYDFNGDGRAEIALKTAPTDKDYRDAEGKVVGNPPFYYGQGTAVDRTLEPCPEWCSVLDGMTGEVIDSVAWPAQSQRFGDYNRNNRNQLALAFLDGKTPCLVVERGTYRAMAADAYMLQNGKLKQLWHWDGDDENPVIRAQGAHQIVCADVDGDGRDEIVLGSVTLDDNGEALWSTGLGHPDKAYVAKVIPDRPGLQIFYALEVWHEENGVCLVDAATGEFIWTIGHFTKHVGDGVAVDIDPAYPGLECFGSEDSKAGLTDKYMFNAQGQRLGSSQDVPGCKDWIWWDGDLLRETTRRAPRPTEDAGHVRGTQRVRGGAFDLVKYTGEVLTKGIQGNIMMIADLRGDWREEIITMLPGELRIYSTTIPAQGRRVCLLQDPLYRSYIAHRSMGYDQPPTVGYYLGADPAQAEAHTPIIPLKK